MSEKNVYRWLAVGLLLLEIFIARFIHDALIRPYVGDVLATIFVYCLLRSFWSGRPQRVVLVALLISYAIEIGQYFDLLTHSGLGRYYWARLVLGTRFAWGDMVAYTVGAAVVLALETWRARRAARAGFRS